MCRTSPKEKQLPFFAYGTLMPKQANYFIWEPFVIGAQPAQFLQATLHNLGDFPMLREGGEGIVHGFMVDINPAIYEQCLADLDYLENYRPDDLENSLYHRVERHIQRVDGQKQAAWVYVGNPAVVSHYPIVPTGNWHDVEP